MALLWNSEKIGTEISVRGDQAQAIRQFSGIDQKSARVQGLIWRKQNLTFIIVLPHKVYVCVSPSFLQFPLNLSSSIDCLPPSLP